MRPADRMPFSVIAIPTGDQVSTLGALVGPLGTLALGAILVALGVLVVGLLNERRDAMHRARMTDGTTPVVEHPGAPRPERDAA